MLNGKAGKVKLTTTLALIALGVSYPANAWLATTFFWQQSNIIHLLAGAADSIPGNVNGPGTGASFDGPSGVAVDSSGNVYVADTNSALIRIVTSGGVVTTLAGNGTHGSNNGTGTAASFVNPWSVAVDSSGNVYVADNYNNMIRKITSAGVVTTFAGSGGFGSANGTGTAATLGNPQGVAVDSSGNVYVADTYNNMIRKITSAGVVTTLAGISSSGSANGTGTAATFNGPVGVAVDSSLNVYVADSKNNMIRKITSAGVVTTLAGATTSGTTNASGTSARFNYPTGVAVDSSGNVYVADTYNSLIRAITSAGVVTTLAGGGANGAVNGTGTNAKFDFPAGVAVDSSGNVYVADTYFNLIRKITSGAVVTTLAGSNSYGAVNGTGAAATFNGMGSSGSGICIDTAGNVYLADVNNNMIRKISRAGVVTTLAGNTTPGHVEGTGTSASFSGPTGVVVDTAGNVYVSEFGNHVVRKVTSAGVVTTLAGGSYGYTNGTGTAASFGGLMEIAMDTSGNLYVSDWNSNTIRKVTSAGVVTTFAGSGTAGSANGTGTAASFNDPIGLGVDSLGNVYVADAGNTLIRKITSAGVVTTLAGSSNGYADGTGTAAQFVWPIGVTVDSSQNVYVADGNKLIRKITSTGVVTTVAGLYLGGVTPPLPQLYGFLIGAPLGQPMVPVKFALSGSLLYFYEPNAIVYMNKP